MIAAVRINDPLNHHIISWSGQINDTRLRLDTHHNNEHAAPLLFHSALAFEDDHTVYCCSTSRNRVANVDDGEDDYQVSRLQFDTELMTWQRAVDLPRYCDDPSEALLQLKFDHPNKILLGTTGKGFAIWRLSTDDDSASCEIRVDYLALPHGVRNITTKMMVSNSVMYSAAMNFAVSGVRKSLYVWSLDSRQLVKVLDAHFGRIIQLESLTIATWNSVITSSIDRSVKIWNINNIFEKVHVIDRHELQIDNISLSQTDMAATVTRGCIGVWNIRSGQLLTKLADSHLGAIVTHAEITPDGRYILSSETGKLLVWNRVSEQVLFRADQPGIQQIKFLEGGDKVLVISCERMMTKKDTTAGGGGGAQQPSAEENKKPTEDTNKTVLQALGIVRSVPDGAVLYSFEFAFRMIAGIAFRKAVVSADGAHIVCVSVDKSVRDALSVFSTNSGACVHKVSLRSCSIKDVIGLIAMPHKAHQVAVMTSEKGSVLDIRSKRHVRSIPKWGGSCTRDGKFGLYAPPRGGLELLELRKGTTVKTYIPKVAEGVFTVICMFTEGDEYVLYYHSGKKTLRVFRTGDTQMIANYRMQTELTSIKSTPDGTGLVLGTVDGCLSVLAIADPENEEVFKFLEDLPSRDEEWKKRMARMKARIRFKATILVVRICMRFVRIFGKTARRQQQQKSAESATAQPLDIN